MNNKSENKNNKQISFGHCGLNSFHHMKNPPTFFKNNFFNDDAEEFFNGEYEEENDSLNNTIENTIDNTDETITFADDSANVAEAFGPKKVDDKKIQPNGGKKDDDKKKPGKKETYNYHFIQKCSEYFCVGSKD